MRRRVRFRGAEHPILHRASTIVRHIYQSIASLHVLDCFLASSEHCQANPILRADSESERTTGVNGGVFGESAGKEKGRTCNLYTVYTGVTHGRADAQLT